MEFLLLGSSISADGFKDRSKISLSFLNVLLVFLRTGRFEPATMDQRGSGRDAV